MEYKKKWDAAAMLIDWECSRFTKKASPLSAKEIYDEFVNVKYKNTKYEQRLINEIKPILDKIKFE